MRTIALRIPAAALRRQRVGSGGRPLSVLAVMALSGCCHGPLVYVDCQESAITVRTVDAEANPVVTDRLLYRAGSDPPTEARCVGEDPCAVWYVPVDREATYVFEAWSADRLIATAQRVVTLPEGNGGCCGDVYAEQLELVVPLAAGARGAAGGLSSTVALPTGGAVGAWGPDSRRCLVTGSLLLAGQLTLAAGATAGASPQGVAPERGPLAVVGGRLLDGRGGTPLHDAVVILEGGVVREVGTRGTLEVPAAARILDARGRTVMPGLIDMHVHVSDLGQSGSLPEPYGSDLAGSVMPLAAKQLLSAGVTTARDPYIGLEDASWLRERIESGVVPGPRLFVSGPGLAGAAQPRPPTPRLWTVSSADEARGCVERLAAAGVDFVKLVSVDLFPPGVAEVLVQEAHERGLTVTAHALRAEEVRRGLAAGVDAFEHVDLGTQPGYPPDVLELIRERNLEIHWVPTLAAYEIYLASQRDPGRLEHPRVRRFLPGDLWQRLVESLLPVAKLDWTHRVRRSWPTVGRKLRELQEAGVTLLVGSDSGTELNFHADATWREMWLWQRLGVPSEEVLQAAGHRAARFLGRSELGVIIPGSAGDLIVVDGDPLESLRDLGRIHAVVRGGTVYVEEGRWVGGL